MIITLLGGASLIIVSVKMLSIDPSNPYCNVTKSYDSIFLEYEQIDIYYYDVKCNTVNFTLYVTDDVSKDGCIALLIMIREDFKSKDYTFKTHFMILGKQLEKALFATINIADNSVSITG